MQLVAHFCILFVRFQQYLVVSKAIGQRHTARAKLAACSCTSQARTQLSCNLEKLLKCRCPNRLFFVNFVEVKAWKVEIKNVVCSTNNHPQSLRNGDVSNAIEIVTYQISAIIVFATIVDKGQSYMGNDICLFNDHKSDCRFGVAIGV